MPTIGKGVEMPTMGKGVEMPTMGKGVGVGIRARQRVGWMAREKTQRL
jgi:hypothetical protein